MVDKHIWYNGTIRAKAHTRIKEQFPDGAVLSVVIWLLPQKTIERPHGFKYRLHCSDRDGKTLVRYDNERGKGDHRHVGDEETKYEFITIEKLVADFYADVSLFGERS